MGLIEWREEFRLGIDSVDHEHRELIELINAEHAALGADAAPERIAGFLGEVHARIAAHFALEERHMRERRYDAYPAHKDDHEHLLDEIREIMDDVEAGRYEGFDQVLAERLKSWFVRHFQSHDARLHRLLG